MPSTSVCEASEALTLPRLSSVTTGRDGAGGGAALTGADAPCGSGDGAPCCTGDGAPCCAGDGAPGCGRPCCCGAPGMPGLRPRPRPPRRRFFFTPSGAPPG